VKVVRVIIADDHRLVLDGMVRLLSASPEIRVVAAATSAEELMQLLGSGLRVDVCVVDLSMPGMGGAEAIRDITARPGGPVCVAFTAATSRAAAANVLGCGAMAIVGKSRPAADLIAAVVAAARGETWVDPDLDPAVAGAPVQDGVARLTPREFDVFVRLARGQRLNDIASDLFLSPKTVSTHRRRILDKLGVDANVDLARIAADLNLLE
jgi:DNA-binding NarL/FixJ family response regulator